MRLDDDIEYFLEIELGWRVNCQAQTSVVLLPAKGKDYKTIILCIKRSINGIGILTCSMYQSSNPFPTLAVLCLFIKKILKPWNEVPAILWKVLFSCGEESLLRKRFSNLLLITVIMTCRNMSCACTYSFKDEHGRPPEPSPSTTETKVICSKFWYWAKAVKGAVHAVRHNFLLSFIVSSWKDPNLILSALAILHVGWYVVLFDFWESTEASKYYLWVSKW